MHAAEGASSSGAYFQPHLQTKTCVVFETWRNKFEVFGPWANIFAQPVAD